MKVFYDTTAAPSAYKALSAGLRPDEVELKKEAGDQ